MKKIVFFLFLLFSLTSQAQNKFPSVDSLQNYTYRYVKNSSVESFTNLRLQNILIGLSQMVDTLRNAGYVDSIWIGADDTLKYRIGNTTFKVGKISGGGSSYSFAYPLQLNTGVVSLDTTLWHSFPFYNTQYQPIGIYLQSGSNGLTSSGTNVKLGGSLSENTNINTNGNRFTIYSGSSDPKYSFDFGSSGIYIGKTNSGNHWVSVDDNEASMYYVSGPDESTGVSVRADSVFLQKYDNFTTPKKQVFAPTTTDTSSFQILAINKTTGSLVRYTGAWPSPTDISGKLNISDTSSMLSPYLPSNVAAATYQPIGSYLTASDTVSLSNRIDQKLNTTDTTSKFIGIGWLTTLAAKQNQLNGTGFVKASGTTITYDNTTYLARSDTSTLSARIDANYATITALGSTGFTLNRPNGTKDTILFTGTSAGVQWTGSDTLFAYNRAKNGRHFTADFDWVSSGGQLYGSGDATMIIVSSANSGSFTSLNASGVNGITLSTASSASAVTSLYYGAATTIRPFSFIGSDPFVYSWRIRINTAVDATDRYGVQVGFMSAIEGNITNGYYFSYDPYQYQTGSPNTSNWATVTANGSTRTWTTTSTAISAGSWVTLTVRVTSTKVIFYVDGTAVAEHSANITTSNTAPLVRLFKGQGTGARTVDVDYLTFDQWYSTPR